MLDLGTLGGHNSAANAINAIGQIAGTSERSNGLKHAFLHANGRLRDLGSLGGDYSEANGINSNGQVVGTSFPPGSGESHASLYTDGAMFELNAVVEFYHAPFDHYFMTAQAEEIATLDAAKPPFEGWTRTSFSFLAYAPLTAPSTSAAVCRFLNDSFTPQSSHFSAARGAGCEETLAGFPGCVKPPCDPRTDVDTLTTATQSSP